MLQREEKLSSLNHENTNAIAYFIEEAQDCFTNEAQQGLTWKNSCAFSMKQETTKKHFT